MSRERLLTGVGLVVFGLIPLGIVGPIVFTGPGLRATGPVVLAAGVLGGSLVVAGVRRLGTAWLRSSSGDPSRREVAGILGVAFAGTITGQAVVWLVPGTVIRQALVASGCGVLAGSLTLVVAGFGLLTTQLVGRVTAVESE